jgi:hypothetical protein
MARVRSVLLFWLLCAFGLVAQDLQRPSEQLNVAGHWQMNASLSDEVPLLPGEALAAARAAGQVRSGKRTARTGSRPDPMLVTKVRNLLRTALRAATHLKIVQAGNGLSLTYADGHTLSFLPDGKETRLDHDGVTFTLVSRWEPPLLIIEREYEDGTTVSEKLASFEDPRQLVATSTIHNKRMEEAPVTFRRVFEVVSQ